MANETQTPWEHIHMFDGEEIIRGNLNQDEPTIIAVLKSQVDAERIVTCVNKLSGLTNDEINNLPKIIDEGTVAIKQRDELLAALELLYNSIDSCIELTPDVMRSALKAINNAKPKTHESTN